MPHPLEYAVKGALVMCDKGAAPPRAKWALPCCQSWRMKPLRPPPSIPLDQSRLDESKEILERHGIDWLKGKENLIWAPNKNHGAAAAKRSGMR